MNNRWTAFQEKKKRVKIPKTTSNPLRKIKENKKKKGKI